MRHFRLLPLCAALALLATLIAGPGLVAADASASLTGETLFVSPSGDDSRTGSTSDEALRQIQRAVDLAPAGSTIQVAAGAYAPFSIQSRTDLRVVGDTGASVSDGRYDRRASVAIIASEQITIEGLSLSNSLWGVKVEASKTIRLSGLTITNIGQEAVHIHRYSSDVVVSDSQISHTGKRGGRHARFGEGIYVGTGSGLNDDDTHNVRILRNTISNTTSEAIDIKQSVYKVLIEGNAIHDVNTNTSGALVVGVGNRSYRDPEVTIRGNIFWNIATTTQWTDGNAISLSAAATVEANVIWGTEHHGILMDGDFVSASRTVTLRNNAVFRTGKDPIGHWTDPNPAQPQLSSNLTAGDAENALGSSPTPSGDNPGANIIQLRDSLIASLGGAPIQQPAPKPTPVPTPATTPPSASPTSAPQAPTGRTPSTTTPESMPATTLPDKASQPNSPVQGGRSPDFPTTSPQSIADRPGFAPTEMAAAGHAGSGPEASSRSVESDHTPSVSQQNPPSELAPSVLRSEIEGLEPGDAINEYGSDTDRSAPEQLSFSDSDQPPGATSPSMLVTGAIGMMLCGLLIRRRLRPGY